MTQHIKELNQIKDAAGYTWPKGAFVAGGAITSVFTGQPIADVDFYFKTKQDFINAVGCAYDEMLWCLAASDRAVTFGQRDGSVIQFMLFDFFPEAQDIFDAFDFTVCMGAYDIDKEEFVFQEDFFKHAAQRHMSFHAGTRYPFGSLLRVLKYQDKGYKINRADMLRIGLAMQKVEIDSWDSLAAAIGGQYGERALVDTNEPFSLDAAIALYANKPDVVTSTKGDDMPGNAYDLLVKVGIDVVENEDFVKDDILWLKGGVMPNREGKYDLDWHTLFEINYESPSGLFWKIKSKNNLIKAGDVAGKAFGQKKRYTKYWLVSYNSKYYCVHRIIWIMRNGTIPKGHVIDHLNGDGLNNTPDNLALKPARHNAQNKRQQADNSSGKTGVYLNIKRQPNGRETQYWMASWVDENLVQRTKCFNISKLGNDEAFKAACEYRDLQIQKLVLMGLPYTERHGI